MEWQQLRTELHRRYLRGTRVFHDAGASPSVDDLQGRLWTYGGTVLPNMWLQNYLDVCVRSTNFQTLLPVTPTTQIVNTVKATNNLPSPISATHTTTAADCGPQVLCAKFLSACGPNGTLQGPGPFSPGTIVRYRMTVTNIGNANATNCVIIESLPAGLSYVGSPTYYFGSLTPPGSSSNPPCSSMSPKPPMQIGFPVNATAANPQQPTWSFPTLPHGCDGSVNYLVIEFDVKIGSSGGAGEVRQSSGSLPTKLRHRSHRTLRRSPCYRSSS